MFLLILLQFATGNFGIFLPLTAVGIFYFTISCNWHRGIFIAVCSGIIIDMAYARTLFITPWLYLAVCGLAAFWVRKQNIKPLSANILPGIIIACIIVIPQYSIYALDKKPGFFLLNEFLPGLIFTAIFSAAFLPLLILILEITSRKLGMPRYFEARHKLNQKS